MASSKLLAALLLLLPLFTQLTPNHAAPSSNLFRSYIGAKFNNVKFTDVPINPDVEFHFILSFAIDATPDSSPTNGKFNIFWDSDNLSPSDVAAIKAEHPNVRVALSLGGGSVGHSFAFFNPSSVDSWVKNAVSSLTEIINEFHLDGIDIDYEHFKSDPDTFAQCIGQLITILKENKVISFASIAPFDNETVQRNYKALWAKHSDVIDFVNFQFYAFDKLTVPEFLREFDVQRSNYEGGRVLASFITDGTTGGLSPENGFFRACNTLTKQGKLGGIFIWSADESKAAGFQQEKKSQKFLAFN